MRPTGLVSPFCCLFAGCYRLPIGFVLVCRNDGGGIANHKISLRQKTINGGTAAKNGTFG
jgi:hypothetical protein